MKSLRYCARLLLAAAITMTSFVVPGGVLADGSNVSISPATLEVENGASFTVDVLIDTDTAIRGWQMDIEFDPSMVQCTGVTIGGFIQTWATANGGSTMSMPAEIDNTNGLIGGINCFVLASAAGGAVGTGTLCTLSFTAQPNVDDYCNITPLEVALGDVSASPVPGVTTAGCTVEIGDAGERESPPSPEDLADEPDSDEDAKADEDDELTLEEETRLAVDAAEYWLDRRASDTFAEFNGAHLSAPLPCYDLEDRLICFRFAVEKSGDTVGTMTIGSSLYDNAAFEVNDGCLPELLSPSEAATIAERDLDITARSPIDEQPEKLLYLGLLDTCAVYEVEGQEVAVNLESERAVRISDLQMRISTPAQYATAREEGSRDGGRDSQGLKVLSVPLRWMDDPVLPDNVQNNNNCGPTSGSMIMEYFEDERALDGGETYPALPSWPEDHDDLYYFMECNAHGGGVWPESSPINPGIPGPGWVEAAQTYNYSDFETYYDGGVLPSEWDAHVVYHIDRNCPILVMFWPGTPHDPEEEDFSNHWNALRGYEEQGGQRYILTNDPRYLERTLDWDVYCYHIHLTMIWDNPPDPPSPPSVGIELVGGSKLKVVLSWLGGLPERLTGMLRGSSSEDRQANGQ